MIKIKKLSSLSNDEYAKLFNRFGEDFTSVMINSVAPIVNDVRLNGDSAIRNYTKKFDNADLKNIIASPDEIVAGYNNTPSNVINSFKKARENILEFHKHQKRENFIYNRDDITLGMLYQPIDSAAMYVPGGKAAYPSSVLMGVIPAQIAGVGKISVITPPNKEGKVPDAVMAICHLLGVDTVIKAGGAQGIAGAGFGTETILKSQMIIGPGNIYVTAAKSYLFSMGVIQIDSLAGPSEILIIADENTNPKWLAYDLLSQAEHEENAIAILVVTSQKLAEEVAKEIEKDLTLGQGRIDFKKKSIENNGLILIAENIEEAINFSNNYGPEHMELQVSDPLTYLGKLKNIGSLFLGQYAPVAVGDYFSGTNHILPTGGAARFSSGVSVETFMRRTPFQFLNKCSLKEALEPIKVMSETEGFADKHGGSVQIRFNG